MINFSSEISFRTARSGGKGGQNVNKVETMVEAYWAVSSTSFFSAVQKEMILEKLKNKINVEGCLMVKSSAHRTQLANKKNAVEKMLDLVNQSVIVPRSRIASRPSKRVKEQRLALKRLKSEKKTWRRKDW